MRITSLSDTVDIAVDSFCEHGEIANFCLQLLADTVKIEEKSVGIDSSTLPSVIVYKWTGKNAGRRPECGVYMGPEKYGHQIHLDCGLSDLCQAVFQFSHVYCHHLINGPLDGTDFRGLLWLEEVICTTMSLYVLRRLGEIPWLVQKCTRLGYRTPQSYLELVCKHYPFEPRMQSREWLLREAIPVLRSGTYQERLYILSAFLLLPLFESETSLWRIVPYLSDATEIPSPEAFVCRLRSASTIDATAVDSLKSYLCGR